MPRSTNSPTPLHHLFRPHHLLPLLLLFQSLLPATAIPVSADRDCPPNQQCGGICCEPKQICFNRPLSQCITVCQGEVFCNKTCCPSGEICADMQNSRCQPPSGRGDLPSVVTPPPSPPTTVMRRAQFKEGGGPGDRRVGFVFAITNSTNPGPSVILPTPTFTTQSPSPDPGSNNPQGHLGCEAMCVGGTCNSFTVSNTIQWSCGPSIATSIATSPNPSPTTIGGMGGGSGGKGGLLRGDIVGIAFAAIVVAVLAYYVIQSLLKKVRSEREKSSVDIGSGTLRTPDGPRPTAPKGASGADAGVEMSRGGGNGHAGVELNELHGNGEGVVEGSSRHELQESHVAK